MVKIAKEITSEGKKSTLRMEKNSCKQRYPQGVYIQHIQTACTVQYQKPNNPIKKINQSPNAHFSKEGVEMAIKHIKRCSASRVLREKQIKCTMRYHLTLIKMALSKILQQ